MTKWQHHVSIALLALSVVAFIGYIMMSNNKLRILSNRGEIVELQDRVKLLQSRMDYLEAELEK